MFGLGNSGWWFVLGTLCATPFQPKKWRNAFGETQVPEDKGDLNVNEPIGTHRREAYNLLSAMLEERAKTQKAYLAIGVDVATLTPTLFGMGGDREKVQAELTAGNVDNLPHILLEIDAEDKSGSWNTLTYWLADLDIVGVDNKAVLNSIHQIVGKRAAEQMLATL